MAMLPRRMACARPLHSTPAVRRRQRRSGCAASAATDVQVQKLPGDQEQQQQPFSWTAHWYPVIPSAYLDEAKPSPFQLLGLHLVLWKAADGRWSCLEDACSHRLAALSEGYIDPSTRTLMCSYHGWRFDGAGQLVRVPQMDESDAAHATACSSRRSCVRSFPVQQGWGLTWVWPESGAAAEARSAATPLPLPDAVQQAKPGELSYFSSEAGWTMREVDICYELLVENILDLSHVPFSHHGVQGRREQAQASPMTLLTPIDRDAGFRAHCTPEQRDAAARVVRSELLFQPPHMVHYTNILPGDGRSYLTSFTTPCGPSKSRYFSRIYTAGSSARIPGFVTKLPSALVHLRAHSIVDADVVLAATQQHALAASGQLPSSPRAYFMPAAADQGVIAFYKWLNKLSAGRVGHVAGAGVDPASPAGSSPAGSSPPVLKLLTRNETLDRFKSHTSLCSFCQGAVQTLERLKAAVVAAAVAVCVAVAFGMLGRPYPWVLAAQLAVVGLAALLWRRLEQLRAQYFYADYTFHDRA